MIITLVIVVAVYEFLIKVATVNLPPINGMAINSIAVGISLIPVIFFNPLRKGIRYEVKNIPWVLGIESLTFFAIFTTYIAMAGLPATIVSSVAASQPLFVVLVEKGLGKIGIKISKDTALLPKLIPILLIVLGIVLLYLRS